jgi:hypothetical protein
MMKILPTKINLNRARQPEPVSGILNKKQTCKYISVVLAFAILNLTIGCRSYFLVKTSTLPSAETLTDIRDAQKTIIIQFNEKRWLLKEVQIKNNSVTGQLNEYTMAPTIKPVRPDKPNRYYAGGSRNQRYLLNEVHLYLKEFAIVDNNQVTIPVSSIDKIELYDKDTATTVGSWVLGAIGITAGSFAVFLIALAIFKESCPFIYTWDGENYHFAGEIYSGAIHQPLERNDYLKLPTYPNQQIYTLKITNEVREIQHTNLMELLVVDHPEDATILFDKYGKVATLNKPVVPLSATNLAGDKVTASLITKDDQCYQNKSTGGTLPLKDEVILEFPDKGSSNIAKLAIRAKNSILLDYMLGRFHNLFGSAYKGYMKKQQKSSGEQMRQWILDQGIPLSLYIERMGKWEFVDYFNIAGPMKYKDDVLYIPLKGKESNPLKMKLEFGTNLWEIDYVAVDYSPERQVNTRTIPITSAINEAQKDIAPLINKDDQKYYVQPTMNNQAVLTFNLPQLSGQERTVILHSKGWYQLILNPSGKPDISYLKTFKQPGSFNQFVNEQLDLMKQWGCQEQ